MRFLIVSPRRVGRYYGLVTVPPPPPPPPRPRPQIIYVRTSAEQSFKDFGLKFCRCIDIDSIMLNIDFRKNLKNAVATRGRFLKKSSVKFFFLKIHFRPFLIKKNKFCQKKFPKKNLENFSKFYFLCIGIFFYNLGYNKKVIGLSALKHFRRENKSIKMYSPDFQPDRKLKWINLI